MRGPLVVKRLKQMLLKTWQTYCLDNYIHWVLYVVYRLNYSDATYDINVKNIFESTWANYNFPVTITKFLKIYASSISLTVTITKHIWVFELHTWIWFTWKPLSVRIRQNWTSNQQEWFSCRNRQQIWLLISDENKQIN